MEHVIIVVCVSGGLLILFAIYDRWVIPRVAKRHVSQMMLQHKEGNLSKTAPAFPSNLAISSDERGFTIANAKQPSSDSISRKWFETERVTAFKRDMYTVDLICIVLTFSNEQPIEIDEEMAGWQAFVDALPSRLPGCRPFAEWFSEVAFPAFATNVTPVFVRKVKATITSADGTDA